MKQNTKQQLYAVPEDKQRPPQWASVPELVEELVAGRCVVLVDDEDRENEGDLIAAASLVTADTINFMAKHARGLICLAMRPERSAQLGLKMQEKHGMNPISTNFTVPIEAAKGVTTGISAADRAHTIRTAVAQDARPDDLVQPGHVFPVRSVPGGVLERAGHTEAGCDVCALGGLEPAAVIVEIMKEDGTMARQPDLEKFAAQHDLKMGSIADLIRYRASTEKTVHLEEERLVETTEGPFTVKVYRDHLGKREHVAFVRGDLSGEEPTLVRVHQFEPLHDLAGASQTPGRWSFGKALQRIAQEDCGVLLLLGGSSSPLAALHREAPTADESVENGGSLSTGTRTVGIGSQILRDLGLHRIRLLGFPARYPSLSGFGLEVTDFLASDDEPA